jgi:DNA-binding CsgD family transcriptional regulator
MVRRMPGRPPLDVVLDGIYEAAADPALWARALDTIGDRFGGSPLIIWLQELPQKPFFSAISRLDPALQPVFFDRYATPETNPAIPFLMKTAPGEPVDFVARMGGNSAFQRTSIYADLFIPQRIWSRCCAAIFREDGLVAPLVLQGPAGCAALTGTEYDELSFLLRHIKRSLRVTTRLLRMEAGTTPFVAALNRIKIALAFADATGRVRFLNRAAERIILAQDGLAIQAGHLVARNNIERALLDRLIAAAASPQRRGGGTMAISRPSGEPRYCIEVSHMPLQALADQPLSGAIIFITDPATPDHQSGEVLMQIYRLTQAEARVALAVAKGDGIGAAAEALGVSSNTLKTLLQRIFAKTGTRRQSELAALVARLFGVGPAGSN